MRTLLCFGLLMCWLIPQAHAASTMRCGTKLVSLNATMFEVKQKCGEPISQSTVGTQQRGDFFTDRQMLVIEEWIYSPAGGMYQTLRFEGGRLKSIESSRNL